MGLLSRGKLIKGNCLGAILQGGFQWGAVVQGEIVPERIFIGGICLGGRQLSWGKCPVTQFKK